MLAFLAVTFACLLLGVPSAMAATRYYYRLAMTEMDDPAVNSYPIVCTPMTKEDYRALKSCHPYYLHGQECDPQQSMTVIDTQDHRALTFPAMDYVFHDLATCQKMRLGEIDHFKAIADY